jgi:cytochrome c peroxidase
MSAIACPPRTPHGRAGLAVLAAALAAAGGCGSDASKQAPVSTPLVDDRVPAGFPAGTTSTRAPADNALTEARAQLGKRLFFDPQLSRTGEISCGTCHLADHAFSDPDAVSTGVDQRTGTRNAPALVNLAWGTSFFWDGRAATLEEQAGKPIENPDEMDLSLADAAARVAADASYTPAFDDAYGGPVTEASLRQAIASFVRVLVSAGSPYDRHLRGDDADFGDAERRGEALFLSEKTGCFHCHPGGTLTNEGFFNNGVYSDGGDTGRQMITGRTGDAGKFKVPGLRNVAASAPYMHDGSLATLDDVLDHYTRGGTGNAFTDPTIEPLTLTADERADLLAFLRALTDPAFLSDPRWRAPD